VPIEAPKPEVPKDVPTPPEEPLIIHMTRLEIPQMLPIERLGKTFAAPTLPRTRGVTVTLPAEYPEVDKKIPAPAGPEAPKNTTVPPPKASEETVTPPAESETPKDTAAPPVVPTDPVPSPAEEPEVPTTPVVETPKETPDTEEREVPEETPEVEPEAPEETPKKSEAMS